MSRRSIGWLLLLGSPGVAFSTLLLINSLMRYADYRVTVFAAGATVGVTLMFAVTGAVYGASLVITHPKWQRLGLPLAAFGALAVYLACVFVAEKVAGVL